MDVIEITNAKENTSMVFPDGAGNSIRLEAQETKTVFGDYSYFEKLKSLHGLVVKRLEKDTDEVIELVKTDLVQVEITNHHTLPKCVMAIGNGKSISLDVGETKTVVGRLSIIKKNHGISCKVLRRFDTPVDPSDLEGHYEKIKSKLGLPSNVEDVMLLAEDAYTASDLQGIARRIGIKARSKKGLIDGIAKTLYGSD